MKASAASNGFKVRLSWNRISRGVKPNASAISLHSFPSRTESNIYSCNYILEIQYIVNASPSTRLIFVLHYDPVSWHTNCLVISKLHKLHLRKIRKMQDTQLFWTFLRLYQFLMIAYFLVERNKMWKLICSICRFSKNNLIRVSSHYANVLVMLSSDTYSTYSPLGFRSELGEPESEPSRRLKREGG